MKQTMRRVIVQILTAEARFLLRRKNPTIIAIAGSVGKTSTKDAIYAAIKDSVPARKSQKSYNSEIGVPLTILGLSTGWDNPLRWFWNIIDGGFTALFSSKYPAVLVLETGVDAPGDMDALVGWLKPDISVITRLPDVPVHVENFSSPQALVDEEMKLVHATKPSGVVIYNVDDVIIERELKSVRQKAIGYGRLLPASVSVKKDQIYYKNDQPYGVSCQISLGDDTQTLKIPGVVGLQHTYAAAAGVATASHLGIPLQSSIAGLGSYKTPPGRMRVFPGIKGSVLIDDTYNSSPVAAEHAIETVASIKHAKRRIAVMGDMLELGKYSSDEHKKIGVKLAENFDLLLTVGVRARQFAEGALNHGLDESRIFQYEHAARAGRELQALLQSGDLVLIKASQGIRAELIVEEVMLEPENAAELLVRQDSSWKKK